MAHSVTKTKSLNYNRATVLSANNIGDAYFQSDYFQSDYFQGPEITGTTKTMTVATNLHKSTVRVE